MINIFTTGPKFIQGYLETKKFTALRPELEKLREEGKIEEERELIRQGQKRWVEAVSDKLQISYEIAGEENIPEKGPFMIYSNHQGFADIPATLWLMKDHHQLGFVAKEEWRRYKILYEAIEFTRSIFLIRDNPKEAVRALTEARKILDMGFNLVIFPEHNQTHNHIVYDFQDKFIDLARLYYKKTGQALRFVPLYIAPKLRQMTAGVPVAFDPAAPIEAERARIKAHLMAEITRVAESLPLHTVVPYRNIPKKLYPKNRP